jgi:hypothetical protein
MDSLLQYAIYKNDKDIFLMLLNATMKYAAEDDATKDDPTPKRFTIGPGEFTYALKLGRFDFVAEMMKRTGVGIPFDQLVKLSGVTVPEKKSGQYEGLTIRGKKKKAWARAYGMFDGMTHQPKTTPPLLLAAYHGSLESVEWLFSDAPVRLYREYVEANKQYADVEAFSQMPGGAERAISQWLDQRSKFLSSVLTRTYDARPYGASLCNPRQVRRQIERRRLCVQIRSLDCSDREACRIPDQGHARVPEEEVFCRIHASVPCFLSSTTRVDEDAYRRRGRLYDS